MDSIDIESYKKLKQLDRIEFLLRREQTKEHDKGGDWISAFIENFNSFVSFLFWLSLAFPIYKLAFGDKIGNQILNFGLDMTILLTVILGFIYFLCVIMYAISSKRFKKEKINLYTEYFKMEPNK